VLIKSIEGKTPLHDDLIRLSNALEPLPIASEHQIYDFLTSFADKDGNWEYARTELERYGARVIRIEDWTEEMTNLYKGHDWFEAQ